MKRLIISLGMNCEVSSRLQFYFGKIPSYPFSWTKINDRFLLVSCLHNNFSRICDGPVSIQEPGMLRFHNYNMGFHCVDRSGSLVASFEQGIDRSDLSFFVDQIQSKTNHLIQKFRRLSKEKVDFIFLVDETAGIGNYAKSLHEALFSFCPEHRLFILGCFTHIKKHSFHQIGNSKDVILYSISSLAASPGNPSGKDGDPYAWLKLFFVLKPSVKNLIRYLLKTNCFTTGFFRFFRFRSRSSKK